MKHYRKVLVFNTNQRRSFINITKEVEEAVKESKIQNGLVLCNAMHITASVFINDDESGLHKDFEIWLEKLAQKNLTTNIIIILMNNADAHLKELFWKRSSCSYNRWKTRFWPLGTNILW